jgi:hypothetical protein
MLHWAGCDLKTWEQVEATAARPPSDFREQGRRELTRRQEVAD